MSKQPARNEPIRLLDDFVCQAIPNTVAFAGSEPGTVAGQGKNAGMHVSQELVFDVAARVDTGETPQ